MFQLHAEQSAGKLFQYNSGYFYIVFFTHSTFLNGLANRLSRVTGLPGLYEPVFRLPR
jgi:hypothetical protein